MPPAVKMWTPPLKERPSAMTECRDHEVLKLWHSVCMVLAIEVLLGLEPRLLEPTNGEIRREDSHLQSKRGRNSMQVNRKEIWRGT